MADLEVMLQDICYLRDMEQSQAQPAAKTAKKIHLPHASTRSVMERYLRRTNQLNFEHIFNEKLGFLLFKDYCENVCEVEVPQIRFYEAIKQYEELETHDERLAMARDMYDHHIMVKMLTHQHHYTKAALQHVQRSIMKQRAPIDLFHPYVTEIYSQLSADIFGRFKASHKFTRYCQWKNFELNMQLESDDFSKHRIIGRGGFGEVYGSRKADSGRMYAMKTMDKKRVKLKHAETLALNERIMLSLVSSGDDCPFIVCMSYAFQTEDKLCFILDLMNGGDLHFQLSSNGLFTEEQMLFYASQICLGLEHMHNRFVVYRDLKPANVLLDDKGHVRISDLGLACDFSKKRPTATVGTHGYMAPEVLKKGEQYDSCSDWFSFGCTLFKLVKGHSPFQDNSKKMRNKDQRQEMDALTMSGNLDWQSFNLSPTCTSLFQELLRVDPCTRLGYGAQGAQQVKAHSFFDSVDWQMVYLRRTKPPIRPLRGQVNAANAFEIGVFDDAEIKKVKLTPDDQKIYAEFDTIISERWQTEMAETRFEYVNQEQDRVEQRQNQRASQSYLDDQTDKSILLYGYVDKRSNMTEQSSQRYARLNAHRLELSAADKQSELIFLEEVEHIIYEPDYAPYGQVLLYVKEHNRQEHEQALWVALSSKKDMTVALEWHQALQVALASSQQRLQQVSHKAKKFLYGVRNTEEEMDNTASSENDSGLCTEEKNVNLIYNYLCVAFSLHMIEESCLNLCDADKNVVTLPKDVEDIILSEPAYAYANTGHTVRYSTKETKT